MVKKTIRWIVIGVVSASLKAAADNWQIPAKKADFHVFLLMGQSNMAGGDKEEHLLPEDKQPVPHIVYIPTLSTKNFAWKPAAHPLHVRPNRPKSFGLGLPFAQQYLKDHPGVTVGLIPVAFGGHCIDKLNIGTPVYEDAMKKAAFAAERGTIKGILWHQGESDTVGEERPNSYAEKLYKLIADVRTDLQIKDLPFIVGDLAELYGIGETRDRATPEKVAQIEKVRDVLKSLPEKVANTGFVDTRWLTYSDSPKCTHFDRASYIILGKRYADIYEKLTGKQASPRPSALSAGATN